MAYIEPSGLTVLSGNLNSAAINSMDSAPPILIPAPGAGLINIVSHCFFKVNVGNTDWAGSFGNIWLIWGTTGGNINELASQFLTNVVQSMAANDSYIFGGALGATGSDWLGGTSGNIHAVATGLVENQPICITCVDPVSPGDGNIDWKLWYYTVKS